MFQNVRAILWRRVCSINEDVPIATEQAKNRIFAPQTIKECFCVRFIVRSPVVSPLVYETSVADFFAKVGLVC